MQMALKPLLHHLLLPQLLFHKHLRLALLLAEVVGLSQYHSQQTLLVVLLSLDLLQHLLLAVLVQGHQVLLQLMKLLLVLTHTQ
jgi:hypothetical protein